MESISPTGAKEVETMSVNSPPFDKILFGCELVARGRYSQKT
jgi:hypothetical protein